LTLTPSLAVDQSVDSEVRVQVLAHMFSEHVPQNQRGKIVLFVSVGDHAEARKGTARDADAAILKRLGDLGWDVRPGSRATFDIDRGVTDSHTGQKGKWFLVGRIEWSNSGEAIAYGEYYEHGKSAEGARYLVVKVADAWKVKSRRSVWKS
jgi:hypothetical protein